MHPKRQIEEANDAIAVFDLGGTWFRWGIYDSAGGLSGVSRRPAINYLSQPTLHARELQMALTQLIIEQARRTHERSQLQAVCVSIGAPVNAHDMTVLGSGPLWGPEAEPFSLRTHLAHALPDLAWYIINDITALLAPYMSPSDACRKTMLITVSSGIGSRLHDHRLGYIPFDTVHGVQGEIGHLVFPFQLDGQLVNRRCECGGWNHMNAFSSGRGIAHTLRELPLLTRSYPALFSESTENWRGADDDYRLSAFHTQLERGNDAATALLDAFVTPLSRALATALSLDPEIDRIVITGGVVRGLGRHYQQALGRTFLRDGLYQISERDPEYLSRRLQWDATDDFSGLRGAGIYAARALGHIKNSANGEHDGVKN